MSKLRTRSKKPLSIHEFESRRGRVRQLKLHRWNARCTHAVIWHSIDPALQLHAVLPRHLLGCPKAFSLVEGRCCLAPADQVSSDSTTKATSDKNMFGGGRRRSPHACVRQGRWQKKPTLTLLAEVLTASPA